MRSWAQLIAGVGLMLVQQMVLGIIHSDIKKLHDLIFSQHLDAIVDANISSMHQVFHSGNLCPFQRKVMKKLMSAQPVKIEVLGGSATYGADLKERDKERWSTKFSTLVNGGWCNSSISVVNRAIPACNVDSWIYQTTRFKDADLVIVDLSVNDQGFDLPVLPLYYKTLVQLLDDLPNHPAILFVQLFRTALQSKKEIDNVCPDPEKHGHCCNDIWWCKKWWDMQDYVAEALHKYKIPYISYRDLVWPVYTNPPEHLNLLWNGWSHPDAKNHALIGKLVSYALMRLIMQGHNHDDKSCVVGDNDRYVYGKDVDTSVVGLCSAPLTKMVANDSASSIESFRQQLVPKAASEGASMWRFYNDSKQKFGWILETTASSSAVPLNATTISFELNFGPSPVLQVTYLKSWSEEMGTAVLWLDDKVDSKVLLPGYWKDEYSVSHYTTITQQRMTNVSLIVLGENFLLPTLTPGRHVVHIAAASLTEATFFTHGTTVMTTKKNNKGFKWKLIGLTSC